MKKALCIAVLLISVIGADKADSRLASIFQDNMVLQREMPVPIWGWADAGSAVEIRFAGQTKQGKVGQDGRWKVALDSLQASNEGRDLDVRVGNKSFKIKNVLVGEVWVAAGQSNMVAPGPDIDLGVYPHYVSPPSASIRPDIRRVEFGGGVNLEPQADVTDKNINSGDATWKTLNPFPGDTTISQYAARVIRDELNVPVGIIVIAVPGTTQTAWMSRETLEQFPGANGTANYYKQCVDYWEKKVQPGVPWKSIAEFEKVEAEWLLTKKTLNPGRPKALWLNQFPSVLYNTRVYPLAPFAIRGFMWHQGEAGPGEGYDRNLVAMIKQWRQLYGQEFYFLWGTLSRATLTPPPLDPIPSGFYRSGGNVNIRHALDLFGPNSKASLVEFYDNGNDDTHWLAKVESGRRLGLAALTEVYGQKHLYTGPRLIDAKIEGRKATLHFAYAGAGLMFQPGINGISGFYLSGKNGPIYWADVKVLDQNTIQLSSSHVPEIGAIAYGENPNPHETLFNSDRLPASPFKVGEFPKQSKVDAPSPVLLTNLNTKTDMHIAHVRRDGYVFRLVHKKEEATGTCKIQAYIPKEWTGWELEIGGKAVTATETNIGGTRYITFDAPITGEWVIVAAKGKAASFRGVNRI